jgi:hypothetical protein
MSFKLHHRSFFIMTGKVNPLGFVRAIRGFILLFIYVNKAWSCPISENVGASLYTGASYGVDHVC